MRVHITVSRCFSFASNKGIDFELSFQKLKVAVTSVDMHNNESTLNTSLTVSNGSIQDPSTVQLSSLSLPLSKVTLQTASLKKIGSSALRFCTMTLFKLAVF